MGLTGAAVGFNNALQQALAERYAQQQQAQQYKDHLRQQQFENDMRVQQFQSNEELKRAQLDASTQQHAAAEQDRKFGLANAIGDQVPEGTFLPESDPGVGILRAGGRGSLLQPQDERPAVETGPLLPGDTGAAKAQGFIKTRSFNQQKDEETRAQQADALQRQQGVDTERERHDKAMESAAIAAAGNRGSNQTDTRTDRSFQYHRTALDKLSAPLEKQHQQIGELNELLKQGTPQADALVAPKLLSTIAGGQGSGLRMNEAEISRIVGGRSVWQNLQAAAQRWSLDPASANSITPEQRQQIRALAGAVSQKAESALSVVNDAGDALLDADIPGHRRILSDARKKLQSVYGDGGGAPVTGGSQGGAVRMKAPDGRDLQVPAEKVAELERLGAKRVP